MRVTNAPNWTLDFGARPRKVTNVMISSLILGVVWGFVPGFACGFGVRAYLSYYRRHHHYGT